MKEDIPEINRRFMAVINHKGYTGYRLAKEVPEISTSTISNIKKGLYRPGQDAITALLMKFTDVSARWLLSGLGEMFGKEDGINVTELDKEAVIATERHSFLMENKMYRDWFEAIVYNAATAMINEANEKKGKS